MFSGCYTYCMLRRRHNVHTYAHACIGTSYTYINQTYIYKNKKQPCNISRKHCGAALRARCCGRDISRARENVYTFRRSAHMLCVCVCDDDLDRFATATAAALFSPYCVLFYLCVGACVHMQSLVCIMHMCIYMFVFLRSNRSRHSIECDLKEKQQLCKYGCVFY